MAHLGNIVGWLILIAVVGGGGLFGANWLYERGFAAGLMAAPEYAQFAADRAEAAAARTAELDRRNTQWGSREADMCAEIMAMLDGYFYERINEYQQGE